MSSQFEVSVILPVLSPGDELFRCLFSIRASLAGKLAYEIVCVVRDVTKFEECGAPDLRFCTERQTGIYGAMNTGVEEARGRYLYFIGADDILLPAAVAALEQGSRARSTLILGDVFWGRNRVYVNGARRNSLVWRNWCHQGIFYEREFFIKNAGIYPTKYKTQSDHYVNIVVSGAPGARITKHDACIAWYSATGFSTQNVDHEFRGAFPALIRQQFGLLDYLIVVTRRRLKSMAKIGAGRT